MQNRSPDVLIGVGCRCSVILHDVHLVEIALLLLELQNDGEDVKATPDVTAVSSSNYLIKRAGSLLEYVESIK